ncbi:hypothetical protein [Pseudomonas phage Ppu-503]|nr:hypothetical protein [Pseudomonas phage Ppu-503]
MSQSIEQIILANTAALEANTAATLTLIELFKAAGTLAPAAGGTSTKPAAKPSAKPAAKPADEQEQEEETDPADVVGVQEDGTVYYASANSDEFGSFPTEAKFNAAKKKNKHLFIISLNTYNEKVQLKAEEDAEAEEAAAAAAAKKGAGKTTSKPAAKTKEPAEATLDEMVAVFSKFISKDLDADVRKERHAFAKDLLGRLDAEKASSVAPEHFSLVIATLTAVMDGEEVDLDEVFADGEDEDGLI